MKYLVFIAFMTCTFMVSCNYGLECIHSNEFCDTSIFSDTFNENASPGKRWGSFHFTFNESMYVFGGYGLMDVQDDENVLCDWWQFSYSEEKWRYVTGIAVVADLNNHKRCREVDVGGFDPDNQPDSPAGGASFHSLEEHSFLIFGGITMRTSSLPLQMFYIDTMNSLWEFDAKIEQFGKLVTDENDPVFSTNGVIEQLYFPFWCKKEKLGTEVYIFGGLELYQETIKSHNSLWRYN